MAEGGALMMISTLWRPTTPGGRAFSQPEGLFEWDIDVDKTFSKLNCRAEIDYKGIQTTVYEILYC